MRTKTLVVAAAALAVGIISSQAQVYSQNIVGYYNLTVPGNGYTLVGQQLNLDNTNSISSIFGGGLVSDPNAVNNTELLLWNTGEQEYQTLYYFNATDAANDWSGAAGFYDGGGTFYSNPLPPGGAAFLYNYANGTPLAVTMVGSVLQATNVYTIVQGYNLFSLAAPISTNLVSPLGNFAGYSDPNAVENDELLTWNTSEQEYQTLWYFNAVDAGNDWSGPAGFYDGGGTYYAAAPDVGTGFFINHQVAGTEYWTNVFNFNN